MADTERGAFILLEILSKAVSMPIDAGLLRKAGYGITGLTGALGGGLLRDRFGLSSVFWAAAAASALALVCAWQGWRWQRANQRSGGELS